MINTTKQKCIFADTSGLLLNPLIKLVTSIEWGRIHYMAVRLEVGICKHRKVTCFFLEMF